MLLESSAKAASRQLKSSSKHRGVPDATDDLSRPTGLCYISDAATRQSVGSLAQPGAPFFTSARGYRHREIRVTGSPIQSTELRAELDLIPIGREQLLHAVSSR
jgi:hypothetical protein